MLYSYHNFLFPFRFDKGLDTQGDRHSFYKNELFEKRVFFDKSILEANGWCYKQFEVDTHLDYNELVYFYDFVKDALFNTQTFHDNATSYFFEKEKINKEYIIKVKEEEKPYKLQLTSISLRIFDTGVAILSFSVENHKYKDLEDILKINEFGRRVYPQFLNEEFSLEATRRAFLAEYISVNGVQERFIRKEYKNIQLANFITQTLGKNFVKNYGIQPLLDDRMFVICWYGSDTFSEELSENNYEENDDWYKYVFVDNTKMVQNNAMQKDLIENATYTRWQGYGTLYGITRYSFMCVTSSQKSLHENNAVFLINHMKTIYFQMVILLLAQRTSILRFSDEITAISDIEEGNKDLTKKISNLHKHYLRFKNKLYFKEVTPQEQGIELYDKARDTMRIDSDIRDLSYEIQSLNSYAFIEEEKLEKEQMNKLTKLGTIFLPGTFIAGVFGMNVFPSNWIENPAGVLLAFIVIGGVTHYITSINDINIKEFFTKDKNE